MASFNASGVGFYAYANLGDPQKVFGNNKPSEPIKIEQPKYHDVYYVTEKKDYSFGTSPNALRSTSIDGKGSPNRSPKL